MPDSTREPSTHDDQTSPDSEATEPSTRPADTLKHGGARDSGAGSGADGDEPQRSGPIPAEARRATAIFLAMLGVTVLLYALAAPWAYAMIVTGPVGAAFGALALWRSRRLPGLFGYRLSVSIGVVMSLFSVLIAMSFMIFAGVLSDYGSCMERAVSQQAQATCQSDYEQGLNDRVQDILDRLAVGGTS
ncbi:hypothetical protein [Demequina sp. NBRC 110056]|uniref:hypothetical protein n=1 Tax=Demequina sp. NBRC 110056 TaxID=1570345 RepID=UPI0009FF7E90|nr:hypothetical protein [Demequina sp. NBRC 110056]